MVDPRTDRAPIAPSGTTPAIDPKSIADLRGLPDDEGNDLLARLVQMLREDAPPLLAELGNAFQRGDALAVGGLAHTLKGSTAYFGAYGFQELCAQIETAGRAGNLAPVIDLFPALEGAMQRVLAALTAAISERHP